MPELPEVETVRRGLAPALEGQRISDVILRRQSLRLPIPDDFKTCLTGARIERLRRRSKYILADTDRDQIMLLHLGMSGRVTIIPATDPAPKPGKHDHVTFITESGSHIIYTDPRRFGILTLFPKSEEETHKLLAHIGPEPLSNSFSEDHLQAALKGKKSNIKSMLLNQKLVAGLGNIYVCEALWRAGISPKRQANSVAGRRASQLFPHIRTVLSDAIAAGGSTLKDFAQADGELGYFQHQFDVYGREGANCHRASCDGVIHRIVQGGRSTFYCPKCQR